MPGASAQNVSNHKMISRAPCRRRTGDMPADFASSVAEVPSRMLIPTLLSGS